MWWTTDEKSFMGQDFLGQHLPLCQESWIRGDLAASGMSLQNARVSAEEVDAYLDSLEEPSGRHVPSCGRRF